MNIEMIQEFIDPQLLILVPMLWGIGLAVKRSSIKNKFIPLVLLVCSCAVTMLHLTSVNMILDSMALASCIFAGITQGSVIWLCAWLTYEKVLKEKEGNI